MLVRNKDQRPGDYDNLEQVFRPSHADGTYHLKYGIQASSGGGRASARETIGRVAAGAVAKQLLKNFCNTEILSWVKRIHDICLLYTSPSPRDLSTSRMPSSA